MASRPHGQDPAQRRSGRPDRGKPPAGGRDRPQRSPVRDRSVTPAPTAGDRRPRPAGRPESPPVPEDVTPADLEPDLLRQLDSLPPGLAEIVARHLVMVGRFLESDPEQAREHAVAARRRASRVGAVREVAGLAAYAAGQYADALTELRAARRLTGSVDFLPVMADCERGLGRPERALEMTRDAEVSRLDVAGLAELRIVASGARRDLGQLDAAVVTLQCPELNASGREPWLARLRYAYADALLAVGRTEKARHWFSRALEADPGDATDAGDRLAVMDGLEFVDLEEPGTDAEPTGDR